MNWSMRVNVARVLHAVAYSKQVVFRILLSAGYCSAYMKLELTYFYVAFFFFCIYCFMSLILLMLNYWLEHSWPHHSILFYVLQHSLLHCATNPIRCDDVKPVENMNTSVAEGQEIMLVQVLKFRLVKPSET